MKPSRPSLSDERLGVWRLLQPLADVPSGQWWRAEHALGRQPAKVLLYADPADAGAVLLRMSQSAGQLWQDAAIAWPLDAGLTGDGRPYVVMPAQDGEPLHTALPQASLRRRVGWLRQLAELLREARQRGLRLTEIDPSLLWLDGQQRLSLQALALVRDEAADQSLGGLQDSRSRAAQPLQGTGTPGSEAALVESLSRLLCLLVNGRLPGDAHPPSAPVALLSQWLSLTASERSRLDGLLQELLSAESTERPASLTALVAALDDWLEGAAALPSTQPAELPAAAAAPAVPAAAIAPAAAPQAPAFAPAWTPPGTRQARWRRALVLTLLAVAVAAGLYLAAGPSLLR